MKRTIILLLISLILIMQLTHAEAITWKAINLHDGNINSEITPETVSADGEFAMFTIFDSESKTNPNSVYCGMEFEQDYSNTNGNLFITIDKISKLGSLSPYKLDCTVDGSTISLYIGFTPFTSNLTPATNCGNGICDAWENVNTCFADCGKNPGSWCGDGYCDSTGKYGSQETPDNCNYDLGGDCKGVKPSLTQAKLVSNLDEGEKQEGGPYCKVYPLTGNAYINFNGRKVTVTNFRQPPEGRGGGPMFDLKVDDIIFKDIQPYHISHSLRVDENLVIRGGSYSPVWTELELCSCPSNYKFSKDEYADCIMESPEQTSKNENSGSSGQVKNNNYISYIILWAGLILLITSGIYYIKKHRLYKKSNIPKKEIKKEEPEETLKKHKIPSSITTALSVSNFSVSHHGKDILNNVSFKIGRGKLVSIIGSSGVGKSTIIESLVGRKKPNSGDIKIFNKDIKEAIEHFGFVPQHMELYLNQTVLQNLKSSATKYGINVTDSKINEILNKLNLSHRKDVKANNLSGGQKKLLSLGMELIKDPELLILDEPTTGLDPSTRNQIITILSSLTNHNRKTILLTTHFMDDCEECDEIIILYDKKIVAQDSPQKLEKRLPGLGKVVNIVLDNVTDNLLNKINKIESIEKVIREGRNLKILTNEPNAVKLSQKIDEIGGSILEAKLVSATMKEVFVYHTGEELDD